MAQSFERRMQEFVVLKTIEKTGGSEVWKINVPEVTEKCPTEMTREQKNRSTSGTLLSRIRGIGDQRTM